VVAAEAVVRSRSSRASSRRVEGWVDLNRGWAESRLEGDGLLGWDFGGDAGGFWGFWGLVGQQSGRWTDDFMQINNNY
jgi:hypothetical protein